MTWTIGVDEAGRGPLAGPVAVGAFATDETFDATLLSGIRDSKTLSESQREEWHKRLTALPHVRFTVAMTSAHIIDTRGIQYAIRVALNRALRSLTLPADTTVLLDGGLTAPRTYSKQATIIGGDATEPRISAAAILAKVTRDRHMAHLDRQHPQYGLAVHKGYGTKNHRVAIATHGLSIVHRTTFCRNITHG